MTTTSSTPPAVVPVLVKMHADDNVAIVGNHGGLPAGTVLPGGVVLQDKVPQAHKVALRDLRVGEPVLRYGIPIGYAGRDIAAGHWVHERLLTMPEVRTLEGLPMATARVPDAKPLEGYTFQGYRNADGSVGTRNLLAVSTTVQCVAGVLDAAVERIRRELLPRYPHVDGVVALTHAYGCGVAIDAPGAEIPIRTLRHLAKNPNFGGEVMLVSLGCEKLQPDRLFPAGSIPIADELSAHHVRLQDEDGFAAMTARILQQAEAHLQRLNARRRETVPASELVVGMQCGGSDAFSGVTANPAVGACTDLLVRAGATVMFSETTEVRDAVEQLTARARTPEVAQRIVDEMAWYDAYLARGGVDRSANTTPGNKAGGLSNIVEKAMGSIVKSGSRPIDGVLSPGEHLAGRRGLFYAATPASDFICGTLQLAAGMNLHVFTTGRGTPYGLAACPVLKVATRSDLARRWHDLMDYDAGRIAGGQWTLEQAGLAMFEQLLAIASGERTWAERHGIVNDLVLFNPAPVT
ncbi:MAG: galactarate dehydratase [Burkholderiaceae bacterium]|nr:galactarate dehydratase [Burkholderiaceae bacterium]